MKARGATLANRVYATEMKMGVRELVRLSGPLAIVLCASAPGWVWGCPNCKDGMANDPNGANLLNGYFWSICFMMAMPYLIFCGLGTYLYLEVRKARRLKAAEAARQLNVLAAGEALSE